MKNVKILKSNIKNNIEAVPVAFNYIKYNRYKKKGQENQQFIYSDLHQTDKYLRRLYYNKFY